MCDTHATGNGSPFTPPRPSHMVGAPTRHSVSHATTSVSVRGSARRISGGGRGKSGVRLRGVGEVAKFRADSGNSGGVGFSAPRFGAFHPGWALRDGTAPARAGSPHSPVRSVPFLFRPDWERSADPSCRFVSPCDGHVAPQTDKQAGRQVCFTRDLCLRPYLVSKSFPKKCCSSYHIESCDTCMEH